MKRRPLMPGSNERRFATEDRDLDEISDFCDLDPTANFPQWSRSLLLLLDYAVIEGLQRELHKFVHHLKIAEVALTEAAFEEERKARRSKSH